MKNNLLTVIPIVAASVLGTPSFAQEELKTTYTNDLNYEISVEPVISSVFPGLYDVVVQRPKGQNIEDFRSYVQNGEFVKNIEDYFTRKANDEDTCISVFYPEGMNQEGIYDPTIDAFGDRISSRAKASGTTVSYNLGDLEKNLLGQHGLGTKVEIVSFLAGDACEQKYAALDQNNN